MKELVYIIISLLLFNLVIAETILDNSQTEGLTKTTSGYILKDGSLTVSNIKNIFLGAWSLNPTQDSIVLTSNTDGRFNNQFIGKGSVVTIGKYGQITNADVKNGKGYYDLGGIKLENVEGSFIYSKLDGFKNIPKNALFNFNNPLGTIKIEVNSDIEIKENYIILKKGELSIEDVKIKDLGKPIDIRFDQRPSASENVVNIIKGQNPFKGQQEIIKARIKGDTKVSYGAVSVDIVNSRPKGVPKYDFDYKPLTSEKPFLLETNSGVLTDQFNYAYFDINEGALVWEGKRDILNDKRIISFNSPKAIVWNKGRIEDSFNRMYKDGLNSITRFAEPPKDFSNKANKVLGTNELEGAIPVLHNELNVFNLYMNTAVYRKKVSDGEELYLINEFVEKTPGIFKSTASGKLKEGAEEFALSVGEQVKSLNIGLTDSDLNKFKKGLENSFYSQQGNFWLLMKYDPKSNEIITVMKDVKSKETLYKQTVKGTVPNLEGLKNIIRK